MPETAWLFSIQERPIMPDDSAQILRSFGITPSPQRIAVYQYLRANRTHPTAETIFQALRKDLPSISLTTIYNTLKLFSGKDLIREVIIEDRELRFDSDLREHAHFKCTGCGRVFDIFPEEGTQTVFPLPALPPDFAVKEIHLCLKGLCKECRKSAV